MEQFQHIDWPIVWVTSEVIVGAIAGILLLVTKYPVARKLGQLLLAYVIFLPTYFIEGSESIQWGMITVIALSLYFYTHTFFSQKASPSKWNWLVVLAGISVGWYASVILKIIVIIITISYLYLIWLKCQSEARHRGFKWFSDPGSRLGWFRNFILLNSCMLLTTLLGYSDFQTLSVLLLLFIGMILYQVFKESDFLQPIPVGNKYQKSTLTPQIKSSILDKIEGVMNEGQFYLRDDASLNNLAVALGASTHHLSQVLNESMKISFQDLIAKYRIRKACLLLRDDDIDQIKIEQVANMVGYNSKSAFNMAFKLRTGLTPSQYRKAKDVRTYGEEHLTQRAAPQNALSSVHLNHGFTFKWNFDMIQQFLKIFTRNIQRNRFFSFLNVFGLTVGFTCSILIYFYISDELSYDRSIPDYDRIYRIAWMNQSPQTRTPHPMAQAMVNDFPEVEAAVSISPWYGSGLSRTLIRVKNVSNNILSEEPDFYFADSTFLDVFQLEVLEGDESALQKPFSLIITEPMARKYFGEESAIGQELEVLDMPMAVSAVVAPMPKNSHFHFNALLSYVTLKQINPEDSWMKWEDFGHFNYIKTKSNVQVDAIAKKIPNWVADYLDWSQSGIDGLKAGVEYFELQPITSIHLYSHLRWELENNGDILTVYILSLTMVFLIMIAGINYVNLTTAKSIERAKEVGVRKTLGAITRSLSMQFYLESVLFSMIAMTISLGFVSIFLNNFNNLSGKHFELESILNTSFLLEAFGVSLFLGLLAGLYPAFNFSTFKPSEVLKGKVTTQARGVRLRSLLVILQFTISAILITGSLMIFRQIQYMQDKELGFDKEAIISIDIPTSVEYGGINLNLVRSVKKQIESIAGVSATTMMSNTPGGQFDQQPYASKEDPENRLNLIDIMVDFGVEELLDLEIVEGRAFDSSHASDSISNVIINESAVRQLNLIDPIGKTLVYHGAGPSFEVMIVGVVKDFHYQSMHRLIQPMVMAIQPHGASQLLVKLESNQFGLVINELERISQVLNDELPFSYHFLDQQISQMYDQEIRSLNIFALFSMIALILACLGLLGMAIASLSQRVKEVGIRKILGASTGQIVILVLGQFVRLVVIALFIGLPIAYLLMQGWIEGFSYRAPVGATPFIWSAVILLVVAIVSVISAVMKISYANPAESLKYE